MTTESSSLVVVEAISKVAAALIEAAALIGIETTWCRDGADALLAVGAHPPSALVVAARTEAVSAARISAAVRNRWSLPILVGAAPGEEELAREALAVGASAVIVRPYDIAAIAPFALNSNGRQPEESGLFVAGPIRVDRRGYETKVGDRYVELTQRELELLIFLIVNQGTVTSTEEISQAVWGHPAETNTVAVHVKRLRQKLGADPEHGEYIRTVRGAGYRLAPSICA
ncbi:DNA-binding response regulator [Mycolicibacterium sp. P9-64]|uniref:winged helix-turn-helix transcriptional regulator n=1 Tax=Mycolicibacterium sp. P9-64 TaxID=2024612 RepID=UPI0011EBA06A|nr:response regulator transcription factor [Mycolicibacterium sp. P9-64]KAA0082455.1 DNA-binding response regulator [Mycolicibacterium sp. P9-64]